jgi:CMP-N-acetylneuraminic acid synthetase
LIDKTVVTTDDNEILKIAKSYDADGAIERPTQLATDEVPLAPVIEHAAGELEESFDYVLCFQPTVPLISLKSLNAGIRTGLDGNADSVVFLRDNTHNYWREHDGKCVPLTEDRKNRQQMDNIYEEIGIFLSRMDVVRGGQRIGESPTFHTVNTAEGIDIDGLSEAQAEYMDSWQHGT